MLNLLSASFHRLLRDRFFRVLLLVQVLLGVGMPVMVSLSAQSYGSKPPPLDSGIFVGTIFIGFFIAAFTSLFLGAEYADGTLRTKICAGHSRPSIYLSSLIVCSAAALLLFAAFVLALTAAGLFCLSPAEKPAEALLLYGALTVLLIVSFTALCVLISMNITNRALSAVLSLMLVLLLITVGSTLDSMLRQPESYPTLNLGNLSGVGIDTENIRPEQLVEMPNPHYIPEEERPIYEFLLDLTPGGQVQQLRVMEVPRPLNVALYGTGLIALSTLCGIFLFRRKSLQ